MSLYIHHIRLSIQLKENSPIWIGLTAGFCPLGPGPLISLSLATFSLGSSSARHRIFA